MGRPDPPPNEPWQNMFCVTHVVKKGSKGFLGFGKTPDIQAWVILEQGTGKIIGTYEDQVYAIKQARYKYRKALSKIDKILLGR